MLEITNQELFGWQKSLTAPSSPDSIIEVDVVGTHPNGNQQIAYQSNYVHPKPIYTSKGQPLIGRHPSYNTPRRSPRGSANHSNRRGGRGRSRGNQWDSRSPYYQGKRHRGYVESPRRSNDYTVPYESESHYYNYPPEYKHNRFLPLQDTHGRGGTDYNRVHHNHESYGSDTCK